MDPREPGKPARRRPPRDPDAFDPRHPHTRYRLAGVFAGAVASVLLTWAFVAAVPWWRLIDGGNVGHAVALILWPGLFFVCVLGGFRLADRLYHRRHGRPDPPAKPTDGLDPDEKRDILLRQLWPKRKR